MQKIISSDGQNGDQFGDAVSISDKFAIVGAPQAIVNNCGRAYFFQLRENNWTEFQKIDGSNSDHLGKAVSICNNYAIVGIPDQDHGSTNPNVGYARIFKYENESFEALISKTHYVKYQQFGSSVFISDNYAIIGTGNHTTAEIFQKYENSWSIVKTINVNVYSVSIADEYAIIGGNNVVYIYKNNSGNWDQITSFINLDSCNFGHSVGISNNIYIIGAYGKNNNKGTVYINTINQVKNCQLTGYVLDQFNQPIEGMTIHSKLYGHTVTDNK